MADRIIRVLLVDDDEDDYVLTRDLLAEVEILGETPFRFEVEWVDTYEVALATMSEARHDAYLVDYRLGAHNGLDVLREAIAGGCKVPIILLTGRGDHAIDMAAMEAGASDYLDKQFLSAPLLSRSIRYAIERSRSEETVRASEAYFRTLIENTSDIMTILGCDGVIRYQSPSSRRILGYEPKALVGQSLFDYLSLADVEQCQAVFAEIIHQPDVTLPVDTHFRHKDGRLLELEVLARYVPELDGIVCNARDVTVRRQAESALHLNEARLEALLNLNLMLEASVYEITDFALEEGVKLTHSRVGYLAFMNEDETVLTMFSWSKDAVTQCAVEERSLVYLVEETGLWGEVVRQRKPILTNDYAAPNPWKRGLPEGHVPLTRHLNVPVFDGEHIVAVAGVGNKEDPYDEADARQLTLLMQGMWNLIQRKRAREEREGLLEQIQQQAQRVQQIIDTVPEGVVLLDAECQIILVNPVAETLLPLLGEFEGDNALVSLGQHPLEAFLTSPPKGLWHELELPGPPPRFFEVIARPITGGPSAGGWVLVMREVTREHEVQQHVHQQERLAAVGQLAAGIAHDFNNILAVIGLYSQMALRDANLSPWLKERLSVIAQQSQRAADLINQILDFSRSSMLDPCPLDLVPFLKEQVKLWKRTLPENIRIDFSYGVDEYAINADPARMQQVFMNLAVNARDAMPMGGRLYINLDYVEISDSETPPLPEMEAGAWVCVSVEDTGIGIPPDVLPQIYDPFFTTKSPGEGTGLGLAQVYGIVMHHGGVIGVQSQEGVGTTFTLYLPALSVAPYSESLPSDALLLGQGEVILVVEDDASARAALVSGLEVLNYRPIAASNGQEALSLFTQNRDTAEPEDMMALVLSDWVMPKMGGGMLVQILRQWSSDIPVIVLSGHPLERDLDALHDIGVTTWLQKPPDLVKLARLIAQVLTG